MVRFIILLLIPLLFIGCSTTTKKYNEHYYQTKLCNELDGKMEFVLKDRTHVDCLTDEYAIEVDFARKWAEGIGQSLFYADMTGRKPSVALIVGEDDSRYLKRLYRVTNKLKIEVLIIKKEE